MLSYYDRKNQTFPILDLAKRAGVSIATVSRVLNGTTPVAQETAGRVLLAIQDLQFVPHTTTQTLASRKTNTIGLIFSAIGRA